MGSTFFCLDLNWVLLEKGGEAQDAYGDDHGKGIAWRVRVEEEPYSPEAPTELQGKEKGVDREGVKLHWRSRSLWNGL